MEIEDFCQFWNPNPLDFEVMADSDNLQSFIYHGGIFEARHIGYLAGNNIKSSSPVLDSEDLVVLTGSGQVEKLVGTLGQARRGYLGPEYSRPLRVLVHEDKLAEFKQKLTEIETQMDGR